MIQLDTGHFVAKKAEPECNQAPRAHFQLQDIQVREEHDRHRQADPSGMWGVLQSSSPAF